MFMQQIFKSIFYNANQLKRACKIESYYSTYYEYQQKRLRYIQHFDKVRFRYQDFTEQEEQTNKKFRNAIAKKKESLPDQFFRNYTLKFKDQINQCPIFKVIQEMPKGVLHHLHFDTANDNEWFMKNLAYLPTTFYNEQLKKFKYFKNEAVATDGYVQLAKLREKAENKEEFDQYIKERLYMTEQEILSPELRIWPLFEEKIQSLWELIYQKDYFKLYLRRKCENFIKDGIYRIEARGFLNALFDEDRKQLSIEQEVEIFQDVVTEMQKICPEFSYAIIVQGLKSWDLKQVEQYLEKAILAKSHYPDFYIGFDMVQEEDLYKNMEQLAEVFLTKTKYERKYGVSLPFVFHGGESLYSTKNSNIVDLILLDSKRIGHGLNLNLHSYLLEAVKTKKMCIEISPLSNQILQYVNDLRLHPAKTYYNYGIPISINCDDPGFFGYTGVSYDFYALAVAQEFDLKDLKMCAKNSIKYSLMPETKKRKLMQYWKNQWNQFINKIANFQ